ncbi:MAG TPA: hypothetical protein VL172_21515 [Kofleriaceae bacterium]|nr:hypothetical protein [Kofleriaceae bacterium]
MRIPITITAMLAAAGCGGAPPAHREELGAAQHLAEADRHEQVAAEHHRAAIAAEEQGNIGPRMVCIDRPLAGTPYSGTEPIPVMRPCWRTDEIEAHEAAARRNLQEAGEHRQSAAGLLQTERQACRGVGPHEVAHGLFWHVDDIVRVESYREGGALRGVRVVFARVPGLDVNWVWHAATCEQARAAVMGHVPTFLPYSPLALPDTRVRVVDVADGIEITIFSSRDDIAAAAAGRAQDLVAAAK